MRILETSIIGKIDDARCEDALYAGEHYLALVDGATSLHDVGYPGRSRGQLLGDLIAEVLARLDPAATSAQAIAAMNEHIHAEYTSRGILAEVTTHPKRRIFGSAAVVSRARRELWLIGDITAVLDGARTRTRFSVEDTAAQARRLIVLASLASGSDPREVRACDPSGTTIQALVDAGSVFQNSEDPELGYGCVNGFPIPERHLRVLALESVRELVLASDGYADVRPTLGETEARHAELLAADPLCIGPLLGCKVWATGTRSYDDRSYVRIALSA